MQIYFEMFRWRRGEIKIMSIRSNSVMAKIITVTYPSGREQFPTVGYMVAPTICTHKLFGIFSYTCLAIAWKEPFTFDLFEWFIITWETCQDDLEQVFSFVVVSWKCLSLPFKMVFQKYLLLISITFSTWSSLNLARYPAWAWLLIKQKLTKERKSWIIIRSELWIQFVCVKSDSNSGTYGCSHILNTPNYLSIVFHRTGFHSVLKIFQGDLEQTLSFVLVSGKLTKYLRNISQSGTSRRFPSSWLRR